MMLECRGYIPYLQMCVCYDRLGEWKTAERYNELAERCRPGTETCQLNRKYFEKRKVQQIERRQRGDSRSFGQKIAEVAVSDGQHRL